LVVLFTHGFIPTRDVIDVKSFSDIMVSETICMHKVHTNHGDPPDCIEATHPRGLNHSTTPFKSQEQLLVYFWRGALWEL